MGVKKTDGENIVIYGYFIPGSISTEAIGPFPELTAEMIKYAKKFLGEEGDGEDDRS